MARILCSSLGFTYRSTISILFHLPNCFTVITSVLHSVANRVAKVCLNACGVTSVSLARLQAPLKAVLKPYSDSMKKLLKNGYQSGRRPSGHNVSKKWGKKQKGAIPSNLIIASNTGNRESYLEKCKEHDLEVHPARFVRAIPEFFIKFLTVANNLVLDPFAGSNVVGEVAESLGRKWISSEIKKEYVVGSAFRFGAVGEKVFRKNGAVPDR